MSDDFGVQCTSDGCTFQAQCACPQAVPDSNVKVTGKPLKLPKQHAGFNGGPMSQLTVQPKMQGNSKFELYAAFIGSPDSAHVGGPKGAQWGVKAPSKTSPFDDKKILIAPSLQDASLHVGSVFVGSPGHIHMAEGGDWAIKRAPNVAVSDELEQVQNRATDGAIKFY